MDCSEKIIRYKENKDTNSEDLIECYSKINELKEKGEDLTTIEGIKYYYLECLILNDYYSHRLANNYINFRSKAKFDSDIENLYRTFCCFKPNNQLKNEIVTNYGLFNMPLDVNTIIFGFNKGNYNFFFSYDLCDFRNIVGIKEFLTYTQFNNLVDTGRYEDAREVAEKYIYVIKLLKDVLGKEEQQNAIEFIFEDIEMDLEIITKNRLEKNMSYQEAFALADDYDIFYRIRPTIKLLCNYYRTLNNDDYKERILRIIRALPFTEETNKLFDELKQKDLIAKMVDIYKMYIDEKIENEEFLDRIEDLTDNSSRLKEFENLENNYQHINFNNISKEAKIDVATANYTYEMLKSIDGEVELDYSVAVIGWSKAVEREFIDKLITPILLNDSIRNDLFNDYNVRLEGNITLGVAKHLIRHTRKIYDNVYRKIYDGVKIGFFDSLFRQIIDLADIRNTSAHTYEGTIDIKDAATCQKMVLQSKKIMEYMSIMPINKKYS